MQNWEDTLLVQFANSPSLMTIIEGFNQAIDPADNIDQFYTDVMHPSTATGWGLDVWGRIVGVSRVLSLSASEFLGFYDDTAPIVSVKPFGFGVFYTGYNSTTNFALTDEWYRKLIFAKAQANISKGSISDINAILMSIFSDLGNIWVEETSQDTMTIVYDWQVSDVEISIINETGILARPSTVSFAYQFNWTPITDSDFGGDIL